MGTEAGKQYYKCGVKIEYVDEKGRPKKRREDYIVLAVSPTDVETKIHEELSMEDFEISSINLLKVVSIIE